MVYTMVQADVDIPTDYFRNRDYNITIRTTPVCVKKCPTTNKPNFECVPVRNGGMKHPRSGVSVDQCLNGLD